MAEEAAGTAAAAVKVMALAGAGVAAEEAEALSWVASVGGEVEAAAERGAAEPPGSRRSRSIVYPHSNSSS